MSDVDTMEVDPEVTEDEVIDLTEERQVAFNPDILAEQKKEEGNEYYKKKIISTSIVMLFGCHKSLSKMCSLLWKQSSYIHDVK